MIGFTDPELPCAEATPLGPRCVLINFTGRKYGFSINDKIVDQWVNLLRQGVDAHLVLINPDDILVIDDEASLNDLQKSNGGSSKFSIISMIKQIIKIRSTIKRLDDGNTIFYLRHPSVSEIPLLLYARKRNLVLEINGLYGFELDKGSLLDRFRLLFERGLAAVSSRKAKGIVAVTGEIGRLFHPEKFFQAERAVITNGVNVSSYKVRKPARTVDAPLRILAVANFNVWHGYDKLLEALTGPDRKGIVHVYFVGEGPEKKNLEKMVNELSLQNVHFLPPMKGQDLDDMYDRCDIALGVLAIERKGLIEMCPLKHREYCARGMPFVMSGMDGDFPADAKFILRLPASGNIEIDEIIKFIEKMENWKECPGAIRKFAEDNLDWSIKMRELKDFMSRI